ncbi:MAG: virulence RhuM family protein [Prevotellaceae bacterium]|jgi:hypothetical protein|nr:virulence RhuM family protein [Prevotellaceae bacterium]
MDKNTKEILHYNDGRGEPVSVFLDLENDTVWLTRQQIAQLFDRDVKTIGKHINNASNEELFGLSTVAKFATVQLEGNRQVERTLEHYNLDMVISVGYRVKSARGIQFRKWASRVLKEYLLKGYAIHRPVTKQELDVVRAELEKQIENLEVITDVQYNELYEALTKLLERKQITENRRPIGFLRQRDNG